jgi:hypothetical protein
MKPSYEQQPGESDKAFHAFKTYRDAGHERSFRKVAQKLRKSVTQLTKWSQRFLWPERLKAFADHMERIEQVARDEETRKKAPIWAAREDASRQANWDLAQEARARVKGMFAFPLATTKSKDGKTIVNPTQWRLSDAARLMEAILKFEAAALGKPAQIELMGKDGSPIMPTENAKVVFYIPEEKKPPADDVES